MKHLICLLLVVTQLAACTTLSAVPYGEGATARGEASAIAAGDNLRIRFREGGEKRITVTSSSADEICAAEGCIRTADISGVERVESNKSGTVGIVLAVLAAIALVAVVASLAGGMGVVAYGG
jgi:hypothetical protein